MLNRARRWVAGLGIGLLVLSGLVMVPTSASATPGGDVDDLLADAVALLDPGDEIAALAVVDPVPFAPLAPALRSLGLAVFEFDELPIVAIQGSGAAVLAAASIPGVTSLWANTEHDLSLAESREMIGADVVHDSPAMGFTGAGVGIAVIDSGIDGLHPDLEFGDKTIQNVKILGNQYLGSSETGGATWNLPTLTVEDVANTDTTVGHGTHVAGIAAGTGAGSNGLYKGVAPGADLIGVGAGDVGWVLTTVAAYDWILANHDEYGIRVVNNSWADGSITYDPGHPLNIASKAAHEAGIVVVFAAGNDGQGEGNVYNRYAFPDWVVGVGGVDKLGRLGDYSSRGDASDHADIVAPGSYIASARAISGAAHDLNSSPFDLTEVTFPPKMIAAEHTAHYTAGTGTSFAAPHVAGVVALMLEANDALTPDQVKQILVDTASPVAGCAVIDCGAGMVNAVAAVQAALASQNQAPTAALGGGPFSGEAPLTATFDASASSDPDGTIVAYEWDFDGDGVFHDGGAIEVRTFASGATHVAVRVSDDDGARSAPAVVEVRSSDAPTAAADVPAQARSGDIVTLDASASADPDGAIVEYRFTFGDGSQVVTSESSVTHAWSTTKTNRFTWTVTVLDDAGVSDAIAGTIKIKKSVPNH